MLNETEIRYILDLLAQKVVVKPTQEFPYTISVKVAGWSEDSVIGKLQAKLSMMLQMVHK